MKDKKGNNFYLKVYDIVKLIPFGKVTTYGAIASYIGHPKSSKMVGWAMNASHKLNIPSHRVVNRKGILTGKHHFQGSNLMQQLLENEGINVEENKIQNFHIHFWDPNSIIEGKN